MEIIDKETGKIAGYAIFNFTKRKSQFIDIEIPLSKKIPA